MACDLIYGCSLGLLHPGRGGGGCSVAQGTEIHGSRGWSLVEKGWSFCPVNIQSSA